MSSEKKVQVRLSAVAEKWLCLDGKPFSFQDWPMHRTFYDGRYQRTLFMTSRQVAKSTTLANFAILECALIPFFSILYVSPSKESTTRFSNTRAGKIMRYSPMINDNFLCTELSDRVLHKQFMNGSEMLFSYAEDDPDRLRGPSTDRVLYDEIQDILYDPVVIVGNETLADSDYAFETYAGTPKTMENTIQFLWDLSTQTEWMIKCSACNKYNYVITEKSVGKEGPICLKCGALLNTRNGQWVDLEPNKTIKGFHVNQLIMPRNVPIAMQGKSSEEVAFAKSRWEKILQKYAEYPISRFRNEVLGVSDEIGTRLISEQELKDLCVGRPLKEFPPPKWLEGFTMITAGVDWSGGGVTGVSRTVLWIWGYHAHDLKLKCLFYKVYPGTNPAAVVKEIAQICALYHINYLMGDAGEGNLAMDMLANALGPLKAIKIQYGSNAKILTHNGVDRYIGDKTVLIDSYLMFLKKQPQHQKHNAHIIPEFGPEEEMKPAIADIMAEFEEVTNSGRKVWKHSPAKPDDCLHAGLYGWLVWKLGNNDLTFI